MQYRIVLAWPILPGSVSTVRSRCGKPKCICKGQSPRLHGDYHRWTGFIDGKRTTKTISPEMAIECKRRIRIFRKLQKRIATLVRKSLLNAPWTTGTKKSKREGTR